MRKDGYSEEEIKWLIENADKYDYKKLTERFNLAFKRQKTISAIKHKVQNLNCRTVRIAHSNKDKYFSKEQINWVIENCNNYYFCDLTAKFNEKFSCNKFASSIRTLVNSLGCKTKKLNKSEDAVYYSKEEVDWLKANANKYYYDELTLEFNAKFSKNKTIRGIKYKVRELNCKTKKNKVKPKRVFLNDDARTFLVQNRKKCGSLEELRLLYNNKFNANLNYNTFKSLVTKAKAFDEKNIYVFSDDKIKWIKNNYKNYCKEHHFDYDSFIIDYKSVFDEEVPYKSLMYAIKERLGIKLPYTTWEVRSLQFPIGREVFDLNGNCFIKISNDPTKDFAFNSIGGNYRRKSNIMYEKYHDVIIDDTRQIVIFLNNDVTDFSEKNLFLVEKNVNRAYIGKYKSNSSDFKDVDAKRIALITLSLEKMIQNIK